MKPMSRQSSNLKIANKKPTFNKTFIKLPPYDA